MNIPPFWARVKHNGISAVGWSFSSAAEAEHRAAAECETKARLIAAGNLATRGKHYYADRPLREPILREFRDAGGQNAALVTRNAYGVQVLNTARLLIVDVDRPEEPAAPAAGGFWSRLFGGTPAITPGPGPAGPEADVLGRAETWARRHAPWLWRVYRTKAGWRFLAAHAPFDVDSSVVREAFDALNADPLYRKLCTAQKCFRARLTPKPWRCGCTTASFTWPFVSERDEARFQKWEAAYRERCQSWRTCEALPTIGSAQPDPQFAELIAFHDETCRAAAPLPLA